MTNNGFEGVVGSTPEQVILNQDSIGDNGKPLRRGAGKKEGKGNKKASDTTGGKKSKRSQAPKKSEVSIAEPSAEPEIEPAGHAGEALETEVIEEEITVADKKAVETNETEMPSMPFTQMAEIIDAFETSEGALSERDGYLNEFVVFDENDGGKIIPKAEVEQLFNEKIAELRASEQKRGVDEKKTEVEEGVPRETTNTEPTPPSITEEPAESTRESTARPTSANSERDAAESSLNGRLAELQPRDLYGNFQTIVDKAVRSLESLGDIKEFGQKIRSGEFTFYRSEENQKQERKRNTKGGLVPITEDIDFDQLEKVDPQECIDYIDEHIAMTLRGKLEDVLDELAENDPKQIDGIEDKYLARLRYFFSDLPDDDEIKIGLEDDIRRICMEKRSGVTKHADNSPRERVAVKRKVNPEVVEIAQSSREDFSTRVYKINNLQKLIDVRNQVEELYGKDILNNEEARDKYSIIHGCIRSVFRNRVENDLKKVHDIQVLSEEFNRIKERYDRLFAEDITGGLLDDTTKQGREDIKALIETRRGEIEGKVARVPETRAADKSNEKATTAPKQEKSGRVAFVKDAAHFGDHSNFTINIDENEPLTSKPRINTASRTVGIADLNQILHRGAPKPDTNEGTVEEAENEKESDEAVDEELYDRVRNLVMETGSASISLLQRRLRLGYTAATGFMDILEKRGVIGPANGTNPRKVLGQSGQGGHDKGTEAQEESSKKPATEDAVQAIPAASAESPKPVFEGLPIPLPPSQRAKGSTAVVTTEALALAQEKKTPPPLPRQKQSIETPTPASTATLETTRAQQLADAKKKLEEASAEVNGTKTETSPSASANQIETTKRSGPMRKTIRNINLKEIPARNNDADYTPTPIPTPEPRRPKIIPLPSSNSPYENKSPAAKLVKKAKGGFRRFLSRFGINF